MTLVEHPSLGAAILRSVERFPDRIAIRCADESVTYRDLAEHAASLSSAMLSCGVAPGDRVAIAMHNRVEIVESFLACHLMGACAVPLNFRLAPAELEYQLTHSGARMVLVDRELEGAVAGLGLGIPTLSLSGSYQDAVREPAELVLAPTSHSDLAFVVYTSGTTGRPKGAMLTHGNLLANTANWIETVGAGPDDVWLSGLPLFHIGGINGVLPFLALGGSAIIVPSTAFNATSTISQMREHAVSICFFVPTQWRDICAEIESDPPAALRIAMWGGSQAPLSTLRAMADTFPGVGFINAFGQTEMSSNTCMLLPEHALDRLGSIGKPLHGVEVRIVDEQMHDVGVNEIGEIVYRGPTVMAGYLDDPEASARALRGGWFHSGDLVRRDEEGFIYIVDRRDDLIVSGGENIYPAEVERVLMEDPRIRDAAVVGVPHPRWVHAPIAIVVRGEASLTEEEVIETARRQLASYKKPQAVVFVAELPRNASGKVLRQQLRSAYADTFSHLNEASSAADGAMGLSLVSRPEEERQ